MTRSFLDDERCVDLLIQEVTVGLNEAESTELEILLARYPDARREEFAPAAAAFALAARLPAEPLPAALRARLLAQSTPKIADLAAARQARDSTAPRATPKPQRAGSLGWWAAAAAMLLAIAGWYPRLVSPPAPTAADLRAQLLAAGPRVVHWEFAPTADPGGAGATGEVVFDPVTQQGYMHFHNLKPNDRRQIEYQLWIFDNDRDARYPVDGGIFNVPTGNTDIDVPITARVRVGASAMFAVTLERAGGVVVSAREHIVVLAKPTRS